MKKTTENKYWRSLDQRDKSEEYRKSLLDTYRNDNGEMPRGFSRRDFLGILGASIAMAGLAGCRRPVEKIVPYVSQPEEIPIGIPTRYATTMPLSTSAYGLLVDCREGRPIKIEGNPDHPSTRGATDAFMQAAILGLYDPDRSKKVRQSGVKREYDDFVAFWQEQSAEHGQNGGAGLAVLSEPFASPTLSRLKNEFLKKYPQARWYAYEPIGDENALKAAAEVTGQAVRPVYHYDKADVILSLDADFMQYESESVTAARDFADGRRVEKPEDGMNRLYVVESRYSVTGGMADHRLRLPSSMIGPFAASLGVILEKKGSDFGALDSNYGNSFIERWSSGLTDDQAKSPEENVMLASQAPKVRVDEVRWMANVIEDLVASRGKCLVVAGRRQPVWVHRFVWLINDALGNIGNTVDTRRIEESTVSDTEGLAELTGRMKAGEIHSLCMLGGNPVYDAPPDMDFGTAMTAVQHTIHLSHYYDESSRKAEWHIPRAHFLESWGDARAVDGTRSVVQPMIEPLFGGKSDTELVLLLATGEAGSGYEAIRDTWRSVLRGGDFEKKWRKVLHDGLFAESSATQRPRIRTALNDITAGEQVPRPPLSSSNLEIGFYLSRVYDGRYANNGWLQELPDPVTRLAWDNAIEISPATAKELGLKSGDVVRVDFEGKSLKAPVFMVPGQADYVCALPLGFGRKDLGRVANGVGFNAYPLRTTEAGSFGRGAKITPLGRKVELANTQDHGTMEGRPIVREATLDEYRKHPEFASEMVEHPPLRSIFPDHDYSKGYQWGMTVDLNLCNGCNACVVACQSENNVPIVGKEQVTRGREMHWIRNDRYFVGDDDDPRIVHQPVTCQQCENAPCEQVCPVAATVHDKEGLNTMNYNRCVGTRYCSNNCPYKVRRFNFFNDNDAELPDVVQMAQNPDVTVRSRGVMEKCTFCIQRIKRAKSEAKKEDRQVRDGELVAACQQACPTKAIQFGNINDPASEVSRHKKIDRNYELLGELNVRPRNSYLARLRNPNPALDVSKTPESDEA